MTTSIQLTDKIVYAEYNKNITPVKLENIFAVRIDCRDMTKYYILIYFIIYEKTADFITHMDPVTIDVFLDENRARLEGIKKSFLEHNYIPIQTWCDTTYLFNQNFTYGKGSSNTTIKIGKDGMHSFDFYISLPDRKEAYPEFVRQRDEYFAKQKELKQDGKGESSAYR